MKKHKHALIIGIAKYATGYKLDNPENDSRDVASALELLGYEVILKLNTTAEMLERAIIEYLEAKPEYSIFYFAGHGFQIDGRNYLACVDTSFNDDISVKHTSFCLDEVIERIQKVKPTISLYIIDACRNNPFKSRNIGSNGLAQVFAPKGSLIAFSTSPGETASDGKGKNSAYTQALLGHINDPDIPVEETFKRIRKTLSSNTKGRQTSWEHTSLIGDFIFNPTLRTIEREYSEFAKKDGMFAVFNNAKEKEIISKLKSHNWYSQNAAIANINAEFLNTTSNDYQFIVGRNIYQSAVGESNDAKGYLEKFLEVTSEYPANIRINIMKGMLFEIFFDREAKFRRPPKYEKFNEVFKYRSIPELSGAFLWIENILEHNSQDLFVVPSVTMANQEIQIELVEDEIYFKVSKIKFNEVDIFTTSFVENSVAHICEFLNKQQLSLKLSMIMTIPNDRLVLSFDEELGKSDKIIVEGNIIKENIA